MKISQHFTIAGILCLFILLTNLSIGHSQFVEKKKDPAKVEPTKKKEEKKKTVKPVINSVVKVVREEAYDIPKWTYGVYLVPQLGNPMLVEISPFVARKMGEKTLVGLGATYALSRFNFNGASTSASHYGARLFGQFYATKYVFAHAGIESMGIGNTVNTTDPNTGTITGTSTVRNFSINLNIGAGLRYPIGKKMSLHIMLLYDMNRQQGLELHNNPVFRVGVAF